MIIQAQECLEGVLNVVFADAVDWTMIYKESNKSWEIHSSYMLTGLCEVTELYFILHVVYLLLSWVIAHCSH